MFKIKIYDDTQKLANIKFEKIDDIEPILTQIKQKYKGMVKND